jgi:hypothetical protein
MATYSGLAREAEILRPPFQNQPDEESPVEQASLHEIYLDGRFMTSGEILPHLDQDGTNNEPTDDNANPEGEAGGSGSASPPLDNDSQATVDTNDAFDEFTPQRRSISPSGDSTASNVIGDSYVSNAPNNNVTVQPTNRNHSSIGGSENEISETPHLWVPWSLRRSVLVGHGVLFVVLILALEVLNRVSQRKQGLATSSERLHYLWTYGPTASKNLSNLSYGIFSFAIVLQLITALWSQIEYRTKQLMPWKNLRAGPSNASSSILLDYISPWAPVALFKALKGQSHPVYAAMIGSLLVHLTIVASTGLIALQTQSFTNSNAKFRLYDRFNSNDTEPTVDSRPATVALGVQRFNLMYPPGTSGEYAVQSFSGLSVTKGKKSFT